MVASAKRALAYLNGRGHRTALAVYLVIVLAHWAEHIAQAVQIYVLGMQIKESRGVLGMFFPWLITSEALHYGYAVVMLIAFLLLRPGFSGTARTWWNVALGIQVWHHFEHLLLLVQAWTGYFLFGAAVPTSIVQTLVPRVELHLFYNTIVFVPMVVAMVLHRRIPAADHVESPCSCAYARA
ncbi:hypothetical protein [Flindersiella endophytica]